MAYRQLGQILVSAGEIDEETLQAALEQGKREGKRLGEVLKDNGTLTERQIIDCLKLQLGVDFVDLTKVKIPVDLAELVPKNIARTYNVVPVKLNGSTLFLAMVDPLNFKAIEAVRNSSKKRIIPMIATTTAMEMAISTLYGNESVNRAIDDLEHVIGSSAIVGLQNGGNDTILGDGDGNDQAAPAIRLVNSILERGAGNGSSDIHIEPRAEGLVIRMRIDGVLHDILTVPKKLQNSVISRIKIMVDMDIAEKRIPQDGRANVRVKGRDFDLRVSTLPTKYGEKIVIRFLEKSAALLTKEGIGLTGKYLDEYNRLLKNANGVILLCGPTGSGKSTTMYAMINELNREEVNVVTLEDPIEYDINGVNQVQVNEKVGMTFANGLRSILRQDPDIIAVGEIRDGETAEIAMRSAITGHLVLSTIHTNSAITTIDRLIDLGVEPYIINSAVKGIISQRLVRRLCPYCKKEYTPTAEDLDVLEMDPQKYQPEKMRFYKRAGCPECMNTGYKGRIAVFEILTLTADIKEKLRDKVSTGELRKAIMDSGFEPMMVNCRKLVMDGVTTVDEASRVLSTTD
ncbi:MAG: Flp pilus assembly complex ATPase component TadA [Lachnospiraceae bacterium]|nr:Flp pilus assembly complex ATPase component TadA [Lachnospiraceae bacterium]